MRGWAGADEAETWRRRLAHPRRDHAGFDAEEEAAQPEHEAGDDGGTSRTLNHMPALAIGGKVTWPRPKTIALGGVPINVALYRPSSRCRPRPTSARPQMFSGRGRCRLSQASSG
jgi:hypothetical protein